MWWMVVVGRDGTAAEGFTRRGAACQAWAAAARTNSIFTEAGRADSMLGQSASAVVRIGDPSGAGSCVGQCGFADSEATGARHVASHHARAGAAAPTRMATIRIDNRFKISSISRASS